MNEYGELAKDHDREKNNSEEHLFLCQNIDNKIQIDISGIETGIPWRLCYIACARP